MSSVADSAYKEALEDATGIYYNRVGYNKCSHCAKYGFTCVFEGWGNHCTECLILGHADCTYIHRSAMDESIKIIDDLIASSNDATKGLLQDKRDRASGIVTQWFNAARANRRMSAFVVAYKGMIAAIRSTTVLSSLHLVLSLVGADSNLLQQVLGRLQALVHS
ncbi:hypothetical protein B0H16DRAFT_1480968 [Mycena metata]|uniref:Uncharacterized protein n=1 Tax=Mycena metata TaxID=1033252 RepID=A0AAD7GPW6_9AGAR|nr:hypothetical protein B0H16DRAFT_1483290 [Mycena metata]KAJ7709344.1 hypothetical protein B0H16DRAFT_1480968 [Mycena metata]